MIVCAVKNCDCPATWAYRPRESRRKRDQVACWAHMMRAIRTITPMTDLRRIKQAEHVEGSLHA